MRNLHFNAFSKQTNLKYLKSLSSKNICFLLWGVRSEYSWMTILHLYSNLYKSSLELLVLRPDRLGAGLMVTGFNIIKPLVNFLRNFNFNFFIFPFVSNSLTSDNWKMDSIKWLTDNNIFPAASHISRAFYPFTQTGRDWPCMSLFSGWQLLDLVVVRDLSGCEDVLMELRLTLCRDVDLQ